MARLLLVDHQERLRKYARTLLVNEAFEVYEAVNADQAIEEAKRLRPDIVVLDYSLPDRTGVQAAYGNPAVPPEGKDRFLHSP
jgi:two-component system, OmpR family, response regulator